MLSRRRLLQSTAAVAVAATFAGSRFISLARGATAAPAPAASPVAAKLDALMAAFFEENLRQTPESATLLGLDKGAHADLKAKLRDESSSGIAAAKALNERQLAELKALDAAALTGMECVNYDTLVYVGERRAEINAFDFGGAAFGPSPYVVSQLTGAYQSVPDFLDTKHGIATAADADAYLARLEAFAKQLDDNTERMKHDAGLGVVPPDFLLDTTLKQMTATRTSADKSLLVTSLAKRAKEKGLADTYASNAAKIYDAKVAPALDRQIDETKALRAHATHDASMARLKDGEAWYEAALRFTTTTAKSPDEIHQLGLDQAKEISARIDALLKAQGLTQGSVGERIAALTKDPKQLYPNTDAGKADAIAYCNARLAAIRPKLPSVFRRLPPYQFEVRRVPLQTEPGAASAFSQGPALDGSRPGIV